MHPLNFMLAGTLLAGTLSACSTETAPTAPPTADAALAAAPPANPAPATEPNPLRTRASAIFGALPPEPVAGDNQLTDARVKLGRALYYDTRLSKNHDLSCNSCHQLDAWGVDNQPRSPGHKGQLGGRNSPTVYNASLHVAQFWDGREPDVEAQAGGPMLNPVEMALPDGATATAVLRTIPDYGPMFAAAFPGQDQPVSYDNAAIAIGAFERGLLTPAPFDAWLAGDDSALSGDQKQGLAAFMDTGCTTCHSGALVGGQLYQKMGLVRPYPMEDAGRFDVTGQEADRGVFKVPSLRNIAKTGPYFHDGGVASLDEAVGLMASHQLGQDLTAEQVASISTFLATLTGELPTAYIAVPELPASGPDTPAPDPT